MEKINWSIDDITKEGEVVTLVGWAYSEKFGKVKIEVDGLEILDFEERKRTDVYQKFNKSEDAFTAGFKMDIPYTKNARLILKAGNEILKVDLNIKGMVEKHNLSKFYTIRGLLSKNNIRKVITYVKSYGIKKTYFKVKRKVLSTNLIKSDFDYNKWYKAHRASSTDLKKQREEKFEYSPKISIVVPTYNTPSKFLVEMIESVVNQSYTNWELCIADGASTLQETLQILKRYEANDKIKIAYLKENYMISGNTNKALELVTGDYIGLFDHDDILAPEALYEYVKVINYDRNIDFIYSDEDKINEGGINHFDPHFKPDWSPDTLRSYNYITHFTVFSKRLLDEVGGFNSDFDGSQDYDLFLRMTEKAKRVYHIPKILYHWRVHQNSTAGGIGAKTYAMDAAKKALKEHIERLGYKGIVKDGLFPSSYKVELDIISNPKVSIIIPNMDHIDTLATCINSIVNKSTYNNYEIIIVENNSRNKETFEYYDRVVENEKIKVVKWEDEFNYSAINNFGVKHSTGEFLVLLNNDIEIISPNWIEEMIRNCQRPEVGIVGAKLYYDDDTIQHAGIILGIGGVAGHSHKYAHREDDGHVGRLKVTQNLSAVTAACLMVRKDVYNEVNGLDEEFKVAFNDVDFCLKIREKGYLVVFTPYAEMYHYESKSRGAEDTPEKINRFQGERVRFEDKWGLWIEDPYYNKNLTLDREDFSFKR